jgi:DNA-binding LacI/PurR family transcriptional regulator
MQDVARLAGVSQRTVSNVVNDYVHVRPQTRQRVWDAIEKLNFRPNASARKLRNGQTGIVALAVPELGAPYFAELADLVQRDAVERGFTLLVDQTGGQRDHELLVLAGYRTNAIDGLILSPLALTREDVRMHVPQFPTVLLGESIDDAGMVQISIDNVAAAEVATAHLAELGRRRIAAVGAAFAAAGPGPGPRRMQGYLRALANAQLPATVDLVIDPGVWTRKSGYEAALELLARDTPPDALLCFNDVLALGATRALHKRGVRIPDDIAVVGWDDIEESRYTTPTLTSISPSKAEIARLAVAELTAGLAGDGTDRSREITPPYTLEVRESTIGQTNDPP